MLVLFDIDGTLLLTRGGGRRAIEASGRARWGDRFSIDGVDFAGRLDPFIWAQLAARNGVDDTPETLAAFRDGYCATLEDCLTRGEVRSEPLPGGAELVDALRDAGDVTLGIVTGNFPETGRLKLEHAGYDPDHFTVCAWGSDGAHRRDLPRIALERYHELHAPPEPLPGERVVVIGDTPHDVDCARANGCRVIAVLTGPSYARADLASSEPDLLVDDLRDTVRLADWIRGGAT